MEKARQHTALILLVAALSATCADAADVLLPSGEVAAPFDVIVDAAGDDPVDDTEPVWRFRYVAPWIARRDDVVATEADMARLCSVDAVPQIGDGGGATVVVTLMERPVEFGVPAPDTVQAFEMYRIEDGRCVWQEF